MNHYEIYEAINSWFMDLYSRIESSDSEQIKDARAEILSLSFRQFISWHGPLATVMLIKHFTPEEIFGNLDLYRGEDNYKDFEKMASSWPSDFVLENIAEFASLYPEEIAAILKAAKKEITSPSEVDFLFSIGTYANICSVIKESSLWKDSCDYPEVLFRFFGILRKHGLCKWRIKTDFLYEMREQWKVDQIVNPERWEPYLVEGPDFMRGRQRKIFKIVSDSPKLHELGADQMLQDNLPDWTVEFYQVSPEEKKMDQLYPEKNKDVSNLDFSPEDKKTFILWSYSLANYDSVREKVLAAIKDGADASILLYADLDLKKEFKEGVALMKETFDEKVFIDHVLQIGYSEDALERWTKGLAGFVSLF